MESHGPTSYRPLALITGAAHRLGKAIALELARQGYAIGLHYHRSQRQAEAAEAEIRGKGVEVFPLPADLTDPGQVAALFNTIAGLPHPLHVLVNSAAVMPRSRIGEITPAEWDATLALNLRAPLLAVQHAARLMGSQGGVVVNISDSGSRKAWTGFPAYIVSKAGLETLTRLMARSLAPGIRVNAVAPGLILPDEAMDPQEWQRLRDRLPLKRTGTPEDVARAVVFLIQNEYITGHTLVIDGGYQLV
jgi:NAD(P)-dependent dehydrogenase (short-subunit alcohol dehydrogenase family)